MSLNELDEKSLPTIVLDKFIKKAIIRLSLVHSFWKMFLIGRDLKHIHTTYSFLELFDLLLISSSKYLLFGVYFSPH